MGKKIVVALGGNALGNNLEEQREAVKLTAKAIGDLIEDGHDVVIAHGNGPQVGMIHVAMSQYTKTEPKQTMPSMSVCVAMSQGYIGYDLQRALREELQARQIQKPVSTILTQVLVDANDPAFQTPTKPIGAFLSKEEADVLRAAGENVIEDSGRGYRRVVSSPRPVEILEIDTVRTLLSAGQVVITCGGGGIPVMYEDGKLVDAPAVVDKDFASATLAQSIDADYLIILTAVPKVAIHFGTEKQEWLSKLDTTMARQYIAEGHFAPGSMLPKVEAALLFSESKEGRHALITLLEKARDGIAGKTGTVIVNE